MLTPVAGSEAETVYRPPSSSPPADPDATYFGGTRTPDQATQYGGTPDEATYFGGTPGGTSGGADAETVFQQPARHEAVEVADAGAPADTTGLPPGGVRHGGPSKPTGPLKVGQQFGARYHILKQLGIGGMGAVYQAWDTELEVAVALKVIRPEVTRDPAAAQEIERRFKQELLLARQVTHKNVVRIHDLGEIGGIKYITMSYIEGADLSTVLKGQKLTIPKVMAIARQIASGLQAAHEAGIVHRDLKPANVMIEKDDHAIIMDFGIARSTSRGGGANAASPIPVSDSYQPSTEDETLTRIAATVVGEVIGTIEYMAPEQARGEHVDQRADVYAFGLIIYDMLAGRRRSEHAVSAVGELQKRLAEPPPAIRTVVPTVPEALDAFVTRCVEPDLEKRFQTTAEMVAALDRLDDNGKLKPKKRVVGLPVAVAAAIVLLAASAGVFWYQRQFIPPPKHDPVSVVIADFQNNTGDPTFDNTLGLTLKRALEGASFITAFDRTRIRPTFGVQAPEKFDEAAARQLAINQGLGVVVAASIGSRGNGYDVSVQAIQGLTGNVIASFSRRASGKDQVLEAVTRVSSSVRAALGDETSDSAQLLAMKAITTTSLDVASHYAAALEAQSQSKHEDALREFAKTVELDPTFGLGYQGMALMSGNLGRLQDAEKYTGEALKFLDKMTDREKFLVRGNNAVRAGDYQQCIKEYSSMIAQYPGDVNARNQRASCLSKLQRPGDAVDEMREVVKILPNHVVFRSNLAAFLAYAGEFSQAEEEVGKLPSQTPYSVAVSAFSLLGEGRIDEATQAYEKLATLDAWGASFGTAGLADLAVYQGRFREAVQILDKGAAADLAANNPDAAALKFATMAYAYLSMNQSRQAAAAARKALEHSTVSPIRVLTGRILAQTGDVARAKELAAEFTSQLGAENQAYGKIIEGGIALANKEPVRAIDILTEANKALDTWLGHFDLGRAYFDVKSFSNADFEFDTCITRRGEALALVQEDPTYGFLPAAYYYLGRVREEIGTASYQDSYHEYLKIRGESKDDPLLAEVRRRAGG